MDAEAFPKTAMEFDQWFGSEGACRDYLRRLRWPDGFCCPHCGGRQAWENKRNLVVCRACDRQVSLTAGTVMHGSRKPLAMWFRAMWWVCTQKTGGSAKGLQRLLGLGSYQTAWAWLHKLRRAMIRAGREPLVGPVEVDDAFIGGKEEGVIGRETFKKAKLVVAVEIQGDSRKDLGRTRISVVPDFSAKSLVGFVRENVEPGSKVITDGWHGYHALAECGYLHQVHSGKAELLPNVHRVIALLKRWLLGTHQGAVRPKQLQHYLDEFAFRHNRRKSHHVGKIFLRMVQGTANMQAVPYWKLVGRASPNTPLRVGGT